MCRLFGHRWLYHGLPADRRVCLTCLLKQDKANETWGDR